MIVIPKDPDAELDLLSMCLLGSKAPEIPYDYFYYPKNKEIAKALQLLDAKGDIINAVSLLRTLKTSQLPQWSEKDKTLYIAAIIERNPCYLRQCEDYNVNIIINKANLRTMMKISEEVITLAQDPNAKATEIAARMQYKAYKVEMSKSNLIPIKQAVKHTLLDLQNKIDHPEVSGSLSTGLKDLDYAVGGGFAPGELWIVAGRPGMGKSALMCGMSLAAAKANHSVLVISLEMGSTELSRRYISQLSGVPATILRSGRGLNDYWVKVLRASDTISLLPLTLQDRSQLNEIEIERVISKIKPELVFIDYLQLLNAAYTKQFSSRVSEISHLTRCFKNMARKFAIDVVVGSQLNRDLKSRSNKRPLLTDLRESGSIEQDADVVLGLYRDADIIQGEAEALILKNRNGKTGKLKVYWDGPTMSFHDWVEAM